MKKFTFLTVFFLSIISGANAQVELMGQTTTTFPGSSNSPINLPFFTGDPGAYAYSYSQSIYLASEINASGNITSLQWYYAGGATPLTNSQNITIYLGHTSKTAFYQSSDAVPYSNLKQVYAGAIPVTGSGWITLTFQTPFNYNGIDNLVVATNETMNGGDQSVGFYNTVYSTNRSLSFTSSSATGVISAINPVGANALASVKNAAPNVIFGGITQTCPTPVELVATNITATAAQINWSEVNAPAGTYEYYIGTSNQVPNANTTFKGPVTTLPLPLTGLKAGTTYNFWVRRICASSKSNTSLQQFSFTTSCGNVSEFVQKFDNFNTLATTPCWQQVGNPGTGAPKIVTNSLLGNVGANNALSAPNALFMVSNSTTVKAIVQMPKVNNAGNGDHVLRFQAAAESSSKLNGSIEVGYFTSSPPSSSSFVAVGTITVTSTNYQEFIVPIGNAPGASVYLGFSHTGIPANGVYIDNVYWELDTSCPLPSALITSNIKSNSATVSFNPPSAAPSKGYQYYISTMSEEPVATTVASGSVTANTTSFNIPNLTPSTTYYLWMRSVCSASSSSWYDIPVSFTTSCSSTSVPWTDGFESLNIVGENIFPDCWNYTNITSTWRSSTGATTSTRSHYGNNFMTVSAVSFEGWAFTPLLHLTAGTKYTYSYSVLSSPIIGPSSGYNITLKIGNVQAPANMTETIKTETGVTYQKWTRKTIEYTAPVTGDYSFGLDVQPSGAALVTGINFDDFSVIATPSCDSEPTAITVQPSDVTDTTARLTWQEATPSASAGYDYYLSTTKLYPSATVTPSGHVNSGNYADISPLTPGTTYYVWVRSVCGTQPTDKGSWSEYTTFVTKCSDATTLSENFDLSNVFPICFRVLNGTPSISSITSPPAPSFPNSIFVNPNSIIALPPLSNLSDGTNRLQFKARGITSNPINFEIGYLTDVNDASTYHTLQTYSISNSTTFLDFDYTPTATTTAASGVKYLAFNTTVSTDNLVIDNVTWSVQPGCFQPKALTTSNTTDTSTYLQWTASPSAPNTYEYYVSTSNVTPADNVTVTGSVTGSTGVSIQKLNATTLLSPVTTYYVWVRSVCDVYSTVGWTSPATFKTLCATVSQFQQNFDGSSVLPDCWTKISIPNSSGIANVQAYSGPYASLPNSLYLYSNRPTVNGIAMVGMPPVNNSGDGTHRLRFKTLATASSDTGTLLEVGYMHNPSDPYSFIVIGSYLVTSTTPKTILMSFGVNQSISPYLAFRNNSLISTSPTIISSNSILVDDVFWETIPACIEPTFVNASNVSSTTATVSWTAATTTPAQGYEYYLSTSATPPTADTTGALPVLPMGSTTMNLTGLDPHRDYYIWVRSVCSSTSKSYWSDAAFSTTCTPLLTPPYTQDFSNYAGGPNSICWKGARDGYLNTGATTNDLTNFTAGNFSNATATPDNRCVKVLIKGRDEISWILSPVFDLSDSSYALSFDYGLTDYNSSNPTQLGIDDTVSLAMLVDGKLPWISLAEYSASTVIAPTSQTATITNINPKSKSVQFAFYESSGQTDDQSAASFFIDNFKVEAYLNAETFSDDSFAIYPNPVKDILNLSHNKNITNVTVCNLLGQELFAKSLNANKGQIDMSSLTTGIYLVKVTADNQLKTIKIIKE